MKIPTILFRPAPGQHGARRRDQVWTKLAMVLVLGLLVTGGLPARGANVFGKKDQAKPGTPLTPEQNALVDRAIGRERRIIDDVRKRSPLVETYLQRMKPDAALGQVPVSDEHFIGRVDFGKIIGEKEYKPATAKPGIFKELTGHLGEVGSFKTQFTGVGFVQMLLMDSKDFDRQHYLFYFVRNDFLGATPTTVFDVTPLHGNHDVGRFFGRIWVETKSGTVVRFNGDFAGSAKGLEEFYHFDSWRTNVQPDLWLPTTVYVDQRDPKSATSTLKFKAVSNIWGYDLQTPHALASNTAMTVENATNTEASVVSPTDESVRQAQYAEVKQAEDNVVERLYKAGLLDAPSEFDRTLEDLANNILAYNQIPVSHPIRVRTLLTEPLESLAVGNTIILSKSLLDTTAIRTASGQEQLGNLNALLAFQLAHILNGDRLDTKYAFNDRLMFPDNASFQRVPMHHSDSENAEAAKRAIEMLHAPELAESQRSFGLYLAQLAQRAPALKALNEPLLGDSLVKGERDPTPWMGALIGRGERLEPASLSQMAAEPLSKFLHTDPWTDRLTTTERATEPVLSASDKMPFEVTPVYLKLAYWDPAAEEQAAAFKGLMPAAPLPGVTSGQPAVSSGDLAVPAVDAPVIPKGVQNGLPAPTAAPPPPPPAPAPAPAPAGPTER